MDEESIEKKAMIVNILQHRLSTHLDRRLKDNPMKKKHWCIEWIRKNISICASVMIYFRMIKNDVSCLDDSKTLLAGPECYLPVHNEEKYLQGAYLYYDYNDRVWI